MKKESFFKKVWRIIYPNLTYVGATLLVGFFAMTIIISELIASGKADLLDIETLTRAGTEKYMEMAVFLTAVSALITIPVLCLFRHLDTRYEYKNGTHVVYEKPAVWVFAVCIVLGVLAGASVNNLISLSGLDSLITPEAMLEIDIYTDNTFFDLSAAALIIPVCEEMIFRWLIYRRLRRDFSFRAAVIFSSLLFALYHGNLVQGIYAFLLGVLFAIVFEKTQSIGTSIALHCGANAFSVIATETEVFDFLYKDTTVILIYTVAAMIAGVLLLNLIYTRGAVGVLIPAGGSHPEESGT